MHNIRAPGGSIIIRDNGNGMTLNELRSGWMRIATPGKRVQTYSRRFHRPLTGAKGVGRFAARRLGQKLRLRTVAKSEEADAYEALEVSFDWLRHFSAGKDLTTIAVPVKQKEVLASENTGVALRISDTRDAWTDQDLRVLLRDLTSLQSPFPDLVRQLQVNLEQSVRDEDPDRIHDNAEDDPGFKFTLKVDGEPVVEQVTSEVTEVLLARSVAVLDGEIIEVDVTDENNEVRKVARASYTLTLPQTEGKPLMLEDEEQAYEGLFGARFRVYMFRYEADKFTNSPIALRDAQRIGRENGGVRIYLNGFRVFPYGDQGDDWLELDQTAARNTNFGTVVDSGGFIQSGIEGAGHRAFLQLPRNNQVFGAVMISTRLHSSIGVNVSRERLIENDTFALLKLFVQRGIYWLTLRYTAFSRQEQAAKVLKAKVTPLPNVVRTLADTIEKNPAIAEEQRQVIVTQLRLVAHRAETELETHIGELSLLRILASAGTMLAIMSHQMQVLVSGVSHIRENLEKLRQALPFTYWPDVDELLKRVDNWQDLVTQQTGFLNVLLSPESRTRRRRLLFKDIVAKVHDVLRFYLEEYGVKFQNLVPDTLRTPPVFEAELYAVLLNLMSNALKAVHGCGDQRVGVSAWREERGFTFQVLDSGKGISKERREVVFEALETDSIPDPLLGIGTGLGLKVVRDLVSQYGGTARFVDAPVNWVTCVEIFIPTTIQR
jgi:signal transduction histidine kinase